MKKYIPHNVDRLAMAVIQRALRDAANTDRGQRANNQKDDAVGFLLREGECWMEALGIHIPSHRMIALFKKLPKDRRKYNKGRPGPRQGARHAQEKASSDLRPAREGNQLGQFAGEPLEGGPDSGRLVEIDPMPGLVEIPDEIDVGLVSLVQAEG